MHLKDLLGPIARVGYCILVMDFYQVLHGFSAEKALFNGLINQSFYNNAQIPGKNMVLSSVI